MSQMNLSLKLRRTYHEWGPLRFVLLMLCVFSWIGLGYFLLQTATYPARCPGLTLYGMYECSFQLPSTRGWHESGLFLWLWATPILLLLEISRRMNKPQR